MRRLAFVLIASAWLGIACGNSVREQPDSGDALDAGVATGFDGGPPRNEAGFDGGPRQDGGAGFDGGPRQDGGAGFDGGPPQDSGTDGAALDAAPDSDGADAADAADAGPGDASDGAPPDALPS